MMHASASSTSLSHCAACEGGETMLDVHHGLVLVLICMNGTVSCTAHAPLAVISIGAHVAATSSNARCAAARSFTSAVQRTAVECTMSGMCAAGSFAGLPAIAFAFDLSPPPSAATPPCARIAARTHVRILSTAPSTSSYRKTAAAPSRVGGFIRSLNGRAGHSGMARAASRTWVQRARACSPAGSSRRPAVKARSVAMVQWSVAAG
mmetsp:Transcript_40190/g.99622  ORF Transcript_40190/g.99622 Transcript_40190/m.99622 type:complete len:207 (-) Transcript_40190:190-810(-)